MAAYTVARASDALVSLKYIREVTQERNHLGAHCVERGMHKKGIFIPTSALTQERSHTAVFIVERASFRNVPLICMSALIQEKNLSFV